MNQKDFDLDKDATLLEVKGQQIWVCEPQKMVMTKNTEIPFDISIVAKKCEVRNWGRGSNFFLQTSNFVKS